MAKAARATPPLHRCLPDEVVIWEILTRLPPKSLLRCRAVCHDWRRLTSTRDFLLEHHGRQPSLPIVHGLEYADRTYQNILAFDPRAADAQLQLVARIGEDFFLEASCDGLLILSAVDMFCNSYSICNPATREHSPLRQTWGLRLTGMYLHRPTSEYRLLLHRSSRRESFIGHLLPRGRLGWYVFTLGSDEPPKYIDGADIAPAAQFEAPVLFRDSLHWYPVEHQDGRKLVLVFDTTTESFRQMHPQLVVPSSSTTSHSIFEMDGTLGISSYDNYALENVDIWMLRNYQCEVWEHKYRVEMPLAEIIRGPFGCWHVRVVSVDGDVFLLLGYGGGRLFHVDMGGKLVDRFHRDSQLFDDCELRLKQTLVPHVFFTALESCDVGTSPFI